MKESRTALGVAWMRAVHQLLDPEPRILVDRPIVDLLGHPHLDPAGEMHARMQTPGARLLRSHVVLRSRYAEDRLAESRDRGVTQYVLLGAGYDTFFARQPEWAARSMRIFEIDQPATQQDKLAKISAACLAVPSNVTFGSVNFEAESLASGLRRHGVSFDQPTFFSWLGVTMYLTEPAIDATLATVRSFPRSSEIVLTFASRPAAADLEAAAGAASRLAQMAAAVGEPWLSYFEPDEIAGKLQHAGFAEVSLLTPDLAQGRYFQQQELPLPLRTSIVSAVV